MFCAIVAVIFDQSTALFSVHFLEICFFFARMGLDVQGATTKTLFETPGWGRVQAGGTPHHQPQNINNNIHTSIIIKVSLDLCEILMEQE